MPSPPPGFPLGAGCLYPENRRWAPVQSAGRKPRSTIAAGAFLPFEKWHHKIPISSAQAIGENLSGWIPGNFKMSPAHLRQETVGPSGAENESAPGAVRGGALVFSIDFLFERPEIDQFFCPARLRITSPQRSGKLPMMPSTPRSTRSSMASRVLTVQVLTSRPAAFISARHSGVRL